MHSISHLLQNIVSETKATRGSLHSLIDNVIVTKVVMTFAVRPRFSPGVTPLVSMEFTHIPGLKSGSIYDCEGQYLKLKKTLKSHRGYFSQVANIMFSHTTYFANKHFTNI